MSNSRAKPNPFASWYSSKAFRALRLVIIARDNGACRMCKQIVTSGRKSDRSAVIDHIEPHNGDHGKFWDQDNLWLVCKMCHDTHCQAYEKQGGDVRALKMGHRTVGLDGYPVWGVGSIP